MYSSSLCVGSRHDFIAFNISNLAGKLKEALLATGFWIFGDVSYPWKDSVLTQPSSFLTNDDRGLAKNLFNYFHSSMRIHIEHAFGIMVSRFSILWPPLKFELARVPDIVEACMRLHNR